MIRGLLALAVFWVAVYAYGTIAFPPETRTKIAVIDTGLDISDEIRPLLCNGGHISFVDETPFKDTTESKHGTNVAGLIAKNLDAKKHCLLIIKFYAERPKPTPTPYPTPSESPSPTPTPTATPAPVMTKVDWSYLIRKSVRHAMSKKVKYINMSLGGPEADFDEFTALQEALAKGIRVASAAGNEHDDLDANCNYFPACYDFKKNKKLFRVVGSNTGTYSNYGKVVRILEDGTGVGWPILSGTSQATAIHMGKWVKANTK